MSNNYLLQKRKQISHHSALTSLERTLPSPIIHLDNVFKLQNETTWFIFLAV